MEKSVKIFLTSGVSVTINEGDIKKVGWDEKPTIDSLMMSLTEVIMNKSLLEVVTIAKYGEGDEVEFVDHTYCIPHDRISWFMKVGD